VKIDVAYGGSCTGGKKADMDMYASVLSRAVAPGRKRVAPGVRLFIQFGSQDIREYAEARGYIDVFHRAGAELINPSCGACIRAGPGVSERADEVTVSAINRNFPGRSGPGKVYLASPYVVAASAIAGRIVAPTPGEGGWWGLSLSVEDAAEQRALLARLTARAGATGRSYARAGSGPVWSGARATAHQARVMDAGRAVTWWAHDADEAGEGGWWGLS
jgi:hypothetical protein